MTSPWLEQLADDVASNLIADFLIFAGAVALGKVAVFAGRWTLRMRLTIGLVALACMAAAGLWLGLTPFGALAAFAAAAVGLALFVLKDISRVGIINSFGSTSSGITPAKSLQLVKRQFDFLGIGAKKLTDNSAEFSKTVTRCREANGQIRILLSSPTNPALASLAARIGRDSQSYSMRVRESIRQIIHVNEREGGSAIQIKLYDLNSEIAFPHFRLMFLDEEMLILSHVVWNQAEGLDNPQLIIRSGKSDKPEESLYVAYQKYFDDLWNDPASTFVTSVDDPRLS